MMTQQATKLKAALIVGCIIALVSIPFVLFGQEYALPVMARLEHQPFWLALIAVVLLAADSVAPIPSTLVIMFLAAKAGWLAGTVGGTLGLSAGVLVAGWVGRAAVGRLAPRFFPDAELTRLRSGVQRQLAFTLICWRGVPVMAETSVIIAAAAGVPLQRIFLVTLLPNLAISLIYSVAADDSFRTACLAFGATILVSALFWWLKRKPAALAPEDQRPRS